MDIILGYRKTKSDGVANMLRTLGNFSRDGRKSVEVNIAMGRGKEGGEHEKSGNLFFGCHSEESREWRDDEESRGYGDCGRFFAPLRMTMLSFRMETY
jgi:hypothetical protein